MPRTPRRYVVHLFLSGGHRQQVKFATLGDFQQWYAGVLTPAAGDAFVNVPIGELEGEYLVVRAGSVIGLRIEPVFGSLEDSLED